MTDPERFGPLSSLVLEVPPGASVEPGLIEVVGLVDAGVVRLLDLEVLRRDAEGTVAVVPLDDADDVLGSVGRELRGATSRLLDPDDLAWVDERLAAGATAVVIVYEWLASLATERVWAASGVRVLDEVPLSPAQLADAVAATDQTGARS